MAGGDGKRRPPGNEIDEGNPQGSARITADEAVPTGDLVLPSVTNRNTVSGMPTITCKLSPALDARLAAASRTRRTTKSAVVREILEASLSGRPARRQLRAYDLVKHLVGSLSGPRDLSHRPSRMDGFGE